MTATPTKKPAKKPPAKRRAKKASLALVQHVEAWERQHEESAEAFQAFALYRDLVLGERSNAEVARRLGKSKQIIDRWSSRNRWQERSGAWELELDRIRQAELKQERVDASRRHATTMQGFLQAVSVAAAEWLERIQDDPEKLKLMSDHDLLTLLIQGGRIAPRLVVAERLALGIATEDGDDADLTPLQRRVAAMDIDEIDTFLVGAGVTDVSKARAKRR